MRSVLILAFAQTALAGAVCVHAESATLPISAPALRQVYADSRTTREKSVPQPVSNASGGLAWGEASWLDATLSMYEATGDTAYLDCFLKRAKVVLSLRDSVTRTADYAGRMHPAWSAGGHYTMGKMPVKTTDGSTAFVLLSAANNYNTATRVSLTALNSGAYELRASNERHAVDEKFRLEPDIDIIHRVNTASKLLRISAKDWPVAKTPLAEIPPTNFKTDRMVFSVHTGMICGPLARFASIVKGHGLKQYIAQAQWMAEAARKALLVHEAEFMTEGDRGWYAFPHGAPMWCDGCPCPNNYSCAMGRAFVHLNRYDPQRFYHRRIAQIASGLKHDTSIQPDGTALWHYWSGLMITGWKYGEIRSKHLLQYQGNAAPEDASHGAIDVEFACMAHRDGIVFTQADVDAIAATLTKRMLRPGGKLSRVTDGTGADAPFSSPWLALTHSHPELIEKLGAHVSGTQWLSVFPVRGPEDDGWLVVGG